MMFGWKLVRAAGVEPASQAWEAHIIADILRPRGHGKE